MTNKHLPPPTPTHFFKIKMSQEYLSFVSQTSRQYFFQLVLKLLILHTLKLKVDMTNPLKLKVDMTNPLKLKVDITNLLKLKVDMTNLSS